MNTETRAFSLSSLVAAIAVLAVCVSPSFAANGDTIPYERFTLDNGLRVIVHEDRKAPVVAVSVWYRVGSKDEPAGKTGFAHLFEHLMFRGSENFSGDFFETLQDAGASVVNGTTSFDRTNYFETVPTPALELALWLESDRMGHLLGAVTQEALDDERSIVKNEKRQREGVPYAAADSRIREQLYPVGHPYHHATIGSMADLDAASLEDVHEWFRKYYGAANAVVVLAGDIDIETARPLMEKYFGDIAAGPPLHRMNAWVPERSRSTSETLFDNVAQTVIRRAWATAGAAARDTVMLEIASSVLGGGNNSRLYRELVEERQLATNVRASVISAELGSFFDVSVFVRDGADPADVADALDEILDAFLDEGPDARELKLSKSLLESFVVRGMESVTRKGQLLAQGEMLANDPGLITRNVELTRRASRDDVRKAARRWLSDGHHELIVHPFGTHQVRASEIDRSVMPSAAGDVVLDLPEMQEGQLSNGIRVVSAERRGAPTVEMIMTFDGAGSNAETSPDAESKLMTADITFGLMSDGPAKLGSASDYSDEKQLLGLQIGMWAGRENGWSSLSALRRNLAASLGLWADALEKPAFRESDMALRRERVLQALQHGKRNPGAAGERILTYAVYGPEHPYTTRWNRAGHIEALEIADLKEFHERAVSPDRATVFVVGDIGHAEVMARLEEAFGHWKAPKRTVKTAAVIDDVANRETPLFILVDRPNSQQTYISAGLLWPADSHDDALALDAVNDALGGGISARISRNLRVEKGWSYGAGSHPDEALAQRIWRVSAAVQSDKTAESVVEIIKEIDALADDKPMTEDEFTSFRRAETLPLPGRFESSITVLRSMAENARRGWEYDRAEGIGDRLAALRLDDVNRAARRHLKSDSLTWVLEGDISQFEQAIRDLEIGAVEVWNDEGKILRF